MRVLTGAGRWTSRVIHLLGTPAGLGLLFAVTSLWLLRTCLAWNLPVHLDTVRDYLLARACQDGNCPMIGAPTSLQGVYQSGFWPLHLAVTEMLGLGPDGNQWLLVSGLALAVGWLAYGTSQLFGALTGAMAALAYLMFHFVGRSYWVPLWNPSILPLGAVGFALSLAAMCTHGSVRQSTAATLFIALAMHAHPGGAILFVPWVLVVLLRYDWIPMLTAVAGATAVSAVSMLLFTRDALWSMAGEPLQRTGGWSLLLWGLLACAAIGGLLLLVRQLLQRRWGRPDGHRLLVAAAAVSLLFLALLWAMRLHGQFEDRYYAALLPLWFLGAAKGGWALLHLGPWRANPGLEQKAKAAAVVLALLPILVGLWGPSAAQMESDWTFRECAALAEHLTRVRGVSTYQQARQAIRSPENVYLLAGLTLHLPADLAESSDDPSAPNSAPLGFNVVKTPLPLPQSAAAWALNTEADWTLLVLPFVPTLQWNQMSLMVRGQEAAGWQPYTFIPKGWLQARTAAMTADLVALPNFSQRVSGRIPCKLNGSQPVRYRAFDSCSQHVAVTILDVQGLAFTRVSPKEVLVHGGQAGRSGTFLLSWEPAEGSSSFESLGVQASVFELPEDASEFMRLAQATLCNLEPAAELAVKTPDAGITQAGSPGRNASATCLASFGNRCESEGQFCPVTLPFTFAVFSYLAALAALGWAVLTAFRGASGSEHPGTQ